MEVVGNTVNASYERTHEASKVILVALSGANVSVGYGMLGCALTLARLAAPGEELSEEQETSFVEGLMDWVNAYNITGPTTGQAN